MKLVSNTPTGIDAGDDLLFLNSVMLLRDVPEHDVKLLRQIMRLETFAAGTTILKEGDPTNDLLIVREGSVSVYVGQGDKKVEITRLGPSSYFGEMSVFDEYPRSANVDALTDVRAYRIDRDPFRNFVRSNPAVLFQMCTVFSHRLRNTNSALAKR